MYKELFQFNNRTSHFIATRIAKIQLKLNVEKDVEKSEPLYVAVVM